ncbi:MAG: purine permease [Candidatus Riflebacteria bacterium]|nr:purine permease [Candidatus Riflebacteria bacterium]
MLETIENNQSQQLTDSALSQNIYKLDGKVPFITALAIGLQHVLAMFLSNVVPIILIAGAATMNGSKIPPNIMTQLIQNAMFIAGVSSLIQIFGIGRIGSRLPIIMGISFTFLSVARASPDIDYNIIMGSVIVGGLVEGFLGLSYKFWKKLISPIVASCVVIGIGISLLPVGAVSFCGGDVNAPDFGSINNWIVASITLISCLISLNLFTTTLKALSPLSGVFVGCSISYFLGLFEVSGITNNGYFSFPVLFPTGMPIFELGNIISFLLIFLVSATETIGDTSAICYGTLNREMTEKEGSGSLACDGFSSTLAAIFGCSSTTSFSQNVGLINLTKVVNRYVVATGALILVLSSFLPPFASLLKSVPQPVLGGCTILMFGQIFISGIKMLLKNGLTERNVTIATVSICLSVGLSSLPEMFQHMPDLIQKVFSKNPVSIIFIVALLFDLLLPKEKEAQQNLERDESIEQKSKEN